MDLDKIITKQALEKHLDSILFKVEDEDELFVITKNGRPRAALINVDYLEELTSRSVESEAEEYQDYEKFNTPPEEKPSEENLKEDMIRPYVPATKPETKKEPMPDLDINDISFDNEPSTPAIDDTPPPAPAQETIQTPIQTLTTEQPTNTINLNEVVAPAQMPVPPDSSESSTGSGSGPA